MQCMTFPGFEPGSCVHLAVRHLPSYVDWIDGIVISRMWLAWTSL
jgi:hypothetical protein